MANQLPCPICFSDEVYSLLNTLHCKRCGNIWKEEKNIGRNFDTCGFRDTPYNQVQLIKITDDIETRMEKKLNEYLKKFNGKFSIHKITWNIGEIQMAMFRRYLKKCVKNRTLVEKKDGYGIIWYSRPD